jgi:hypothetical protein
MNEDIQLPDRHFTLKGWHIALAVLIVLVGLIGLYFVLCRSKVEQRLEALRAGGYPTSFTELAEYTKLPDGVENAADVYTRAFAAFVPPVEEANVPLLGKAKWPDRGTPLAEPTAQAISMCLASNQQCLALLHEAAGIELCQYDWDYGQVMPHTREMKRCAQLLSLGAAFHTHEGDTDAAVVCIRDGLRLSDSLHREPALISHLVRIAFIGVALGGLERSLNLTTFTDQQLTALGDALSRTAGSLDFTQALVTERCRMIEACRDPSLLADSSVPVRLFPGMRGMWLADTLDVMEDRIEASRQPPAERLRRFRKGDDEIRQLSFLHGMIKNVTPAMTRVAELDLRLRAHLDLAKAALAVERYRLATGKAPGQLEELVPQYLERVLIDLFDSQPIRYRRTNPGYLLYSVDTDGRDNGGRERSEKDRGAPYDLRFVVTR